jgi:hypothetical protein
VSLDQVLGPTFQTGESVVVVTRSKTLCALDAATGTIRCTRILTQQQLVDAEESPEGLLLLEVNAGSGCS